MYFLIIINKIVDLLWNSKYRQILLFHLIIILGGINYENIYQYAELGGNSLINSTNKKIYLANKFTKKTTKDEYITQVSILVPETYTCKVYLNPNGDSINESDLQQVQLKAGESETFEAGYHTIEFSKPIKINSTNFAVVIEIEGTYQEITQ